VDLAGIAGLPTYYEALIYRAAGLICWLATYGPFDIAGLTVVLCGVLELAAGACIRGAVYLGVPKL